MRAVHRATSFLNVPLALAIALALSTAAAAEEPAAAPQDEGPGPGEPLKFQIGHHFARTDAKVRVQQLLSYWTQAFGVKNHWEGDHARLRGKVLGVAFQARLDVTDTSVGGEATDPGALFRAAASDYVKRKLRKYLSPHYDDF
jgi:hypothetical protein